MIELTNSYLELVTSSNPDFRKFRDRSFPFIINCLINKIFILLEPHQRAYQLGRRDLSKRYGLKSEDGVTLITNPDGSVPIAPKNRSIFNDEFNKLQSQKFVLDNVEPLVIDTNDEIYNELSIGEGAILYPLLDHSTILVEVNDKKEDD